MSEHTPTGDPKSSPPENTTTPINMLPLTIPYELRNAEAIHNAMLQESKAYHDNLRRKAEDFLAQHLLTERLKAVKLEGEQKEAKAKLERDILLQQKKADEAETSLLLAAAERNEADKKKREAEIKARETENALRLTPEVPALVAKPPPPPAPVNPAPAAQKPAASQPAKQPPASQSQAPQSQPTTQAPVAQRQTPQPVLNNAATSASTPTPAQPVAATPSINDATQSGRNLSDMVDLPETQRYIDIHQQLKLLRNQVKPKGKANTSPLKEQAMKLGSAIRIAIGQLSTGGKNGATFIKIRGIMAEACTYQVNGQVLLMDPSPYVVRVPEPSSDPQAKNNGDQLPVLFIYILSVFSKVLVAQAAQEASQKSEAAEPIALAAHQTFSHPDLLWRGMSMIDILVAKLRKSCGTLFGFRGTENLESGRVTLGWKKEDGNWISESYHYDRMRGIGAFYAGLTLRTYKNRVNPYPPHHYWRAMAAILSCPQQERSNTSYYVLCALIQGYEQKFLAAYGNMARHALEAALVYYPRGAREQNAAVMTLIALGEKIAKEGLSLE